MVLTSFVRELTEKSGRYIVFQSCPAEGSRGLPCNDLLGLQVWCEGGNCNVTGGLIYLHLKDHRMTMGVIYTTVVIFSIYVSRVVHPVFSGELRLPPTIQKHAFGVCIACIAHSKLPIGVNECGVVCVFMSALW